MQLLLGTRPTEPNRGEIRLRLLLLSFLPDCVEINGRDIVGPSAVSNVIQEDPHVKFVKAAKTVDCFDHVSVCFEERRVVVELLSSPSLVLA